MNSKGFTLIELLIVMALLALISGVVVPRLWGQYTSFKEQHSIESLWGKVQLEAQKKNDASEVFFIDERSISWLTKLAEQKQLSIESYQPIFYRADGFVTSGYILFKSDAGNRWRLEVEMPYGKVKIHKSE